MALHAFDPYFDMAGEFVGFHHEAGIITDKFHAQDVVPIAARNPILWGVFCDKGKSGEQVTGSTIKLKLADLFFEASSEKLATFTRSCVVV